MPKRNNTTKLLLNTLRMWGWPFLFSRLDASAMLVCDEEVLTELNAICGGLKCQTSSADKLESLTPTTQVVIVFVQNNELTLTRELRDQYPDITILSAAHDLAANAGADKPALPNFSGRTKRDQKTLSTKPILILATHGADSPYLVGLLKDNNLANPVEYMGGPLVDLMKWLDRFSLATFTANLRKLYGSSPEFCMLLRTDVCIALMENAGLTEDSFLRYLRTAGYRVICLSREDRITQCAQAQLFHGRKIRSVWDIPVGQREKFAEKAGLPVAGSIENLRDIARGEHLIKLISGSDIPSIAFSLEQLLANPKASLQNVCSLLGKQTIDSLQIAPYTAPANEVPIVGKLAATLKRELIDRTGLHTC